MPQLARSQEDPTVAYVERESEVVSPLTCCALAFVARDGLFEKQLRVIDLNFVSAHQMH
jgi:hypothetical protein